MILNNYIATINHQSLKSCLNNKEIIKVFSYLVAVTTQAGVLIVGAPHLAKLLEKNYPASSGWSWVVWPLSLAVVAHLFWVFIRYLLKVDKENSKKK